MASTIDHLVIAAQTLEEGAAFVQAKLGVALQRGGKHERMGTHNGLVRLGQRLYLEVIAVDPEGGTPFQPRWFGLDTPGLRSDLMDGPRLITWVAATDNIVALAARCPEPLGDIHFMRRGSYAWKITVPEDGHLPGEGLIPTLIEWQGEHPAEHLADQGCVLEALAGAYERPEAIRRVLKVLDLAGAMPVSQGIARLAARIRTPFGVRTLSS